MKLMLTFALCLAAAVALPVDPAREDQPAAEEAKKQEKRGILGLGLPLSAPLTLPAPAYHSPLALPAPAYHAPAYHAPLALPALPALPALHAPIALPAPAIHAPLALPAFAPAFKTLAAPLTLPSLPLGKIW